jgi:hypothetical protein
LVPVRKYSKSKNIKVALNKEWTKFIYLRVIRTFHKEKKEEENDASLIGFYQGMTIISWYFPHLIFGLSPFL